MSARKVISFRETRPGEVWKSPKGWRAKNQDGSAQTFDSKEQAEQFAKGKKEEKKKKPQKSEQSTSSEETVQALKNIGTTPTETTMSEEKAKSFVSKFMEKAKNVSKGMAKVIKEAPLATKQFITDTEFRNKALKKSASMLRDNASSLAKTIVASAKSEATDFARPFTAPATIINRIKKGEKPLLTKDEKFSLYSGLVYWGCIIGSFSMSHMGGYGGMTAMDAGTEIGDAFMHSYTLHTAFGVVATMMKGAFKDNPPSKEEIEKAIKDGSINPDDVKKAIEEDTTLSDEDKEGYLEQLGDMNDDPNKLFLFVEQIENTNLFMNIFGAAGFIPDNFVVSTGALYDYSPWAMAKEIFSKGADVITKLGKEDEPKVKEVENFIKLYADQMESTTDEDMLYLATLDSKPYGKITKAVNDGAEKHKKEEKKKKTKKALQMKMARSVAIEYLSRQSAYKDKKKVVNQDGKESTIYIYSDEHIKKRHKEKSKKIEKLRKCVSDFRSKYRRDIDGSDERKSVVALAVSLIDLTYERVGNPTSAENGHFGITGLQKRHIKFSNGKAILTYIGKSGVKQTKEITDSKVVSKLKEITKKKSKAENIFTYGEDFCVSARLVNAYLKDFGISAKDIRGFHANEEMKKALKAIRKESGKLPSEEKEKSKQLKKEFSQALKQVAKIVGHQHSTLKNQYLVPHLQEAFLEKGKVITSLKTAKKTDAEKEDEQVEDIHKKNPKERPPRYDLRKRRIEEEDKDLDTADKDLSLKHEDYKRASLEERVAMMWLVADDRVYVWNTETERTTKVKPSTLKKYPQKYKILKYDETEEETEDEEDFISEEEDFISEEEEDFTGEIGEDDEVTEEIDTSVTEKKEEPKKEEPKKKEPKKKEPKKEKSKEETLKEEVLKEEDPIGEQVQDLSSKGLSSYADEIKGSELGDKVKEKIMKEISAVYDNFSKKDRNETMSSKDLKEIMENSNPSAKDLSDDEIAKAYSNKMIIDTFLTDPDKVGDNSLKAEELGQQVFIQINQYDDNLKKKLEENIDTKLSGLDNKSDEYAKLKAKKDALGVNRVMSSNKGSGVIGLLLGGVEPKHFSDLSHAEEVKEKFKAVSDYLNSKDEGSRQEMVRDIVRSSSFDEIEESFKGNKVFQGWNDALANSWDPEMQGWAKEFLANQAALFGSDEEYAQAKKQYDKEQKEQKKKEKGNKRNVSEKDRLTIDSDFNIGFNDFILELLSTDGFSIEQADKTLRLNFLSRLASKNNGKITPEVRTALKEQFSLSFEDDGSVETKERNKLEEKLALSSLKYEKGEAWEIDDGYGAKNSKGYIRYFEKKEEAEQFKVSSLNFQSFIYNSMNIDSGLSIITNSTHSNWRDNIMSKINKQSALKVSGQLDRIASLFEKDFDALGVPEKIAKDFAYRCDLLSDSIEQNFGVNKQALDDLDPVLEPGFNPDDIGREVGGPLEDNGEHSWQEGEFSRQEHRELRDLQESGEMAEVQEEPRQPQPGKQANENIDTVISRLSKQADMSSVNKCSDLRDELKVCCIKLQESGVASVKSLASACDKLVSALDKIKEECIKAEALGSDNLSLEVSCEKACGAVEEILPFVERLCSSLNHLNEGSPVAQFQVEEMLEQSSAKLEKLVGLAVKIVADALSDLSKKEE